MCRVIQHHTEHRTHCFGDGGEVPTLWSPATRMEARRPNLPSLTWAPAPAGASSSLLPTKKTPILLTVALSCLPLAPPILWPPDPPSMSPQDIPHSPPSTQAPLCLLPLRRIILGSWPTFFLGCPPRPTLDPCSPLSTFSVSLCPGKATRSWRHSCSSPTAICLQGGHQMGQMGCPSLTFHGGPGPGWRGQDALDP